MFVYAVQSQHVPEKIFVRLTYTYIITNTLYKLHSFVVLESLGIATPILVSAAHVNSSPALPLLIVQEYWEMSLNVERDRARELSCIPRKIQWFITIVTSAAWTALCILTLLLFFT